MQRWSWQSGSQSFTGAWAGAVGGRGAPVAVIVVENWIRSAAGDYIPGSV